MNIMEGRDICVLRTHTHTHTHADMNTHVHIYLTHKLLAVTYITLWSAIVLRNFFSLDRAETHSRNLSERTNKARDVIERSNAISCSFKPNASLGSPKTAPQSVERRERDSPRFVIRAIQASCGRLIVRPNFDLLVGEPRGKKSSVRLGHPERDDIKFLPTSGDEIVRNFLNFFG